MRLLKTLVICFAFLAAGAANAERVFDLEIKIKFNSSGVRFDDTVTGLLTLYDDRTYVWEQFGEEFGGVWIQEKNKIQLFEESDFATAELIAWLEQDASNFVGFPVMLTSLKSKETARLDRAGNLKLRYKEVTTFRPGLKGTRPLKITWSHTVIGTLR